MQIRLSTPRKPKNPLLPSTPGRNRLAKECLPSLPCLLCQFLRQLLLCVLSISMSVRSSSLLVLSSELLALKSASLALSSSDAACRTLLLKMIFAIAVTMGCKFVSMVVSSKAVGRCTRYVVWFVMRLGRVAPGAEGSSWVTSGTVPWRVVLVLSHSSALLGLTHT